MKRGILHWTDKTVGTLHAAKKAVVKLNNNIMLLNKAFPITTSRMLYNENRVVRQFFDGIKLYRGADFLLDILPKISPMEYKLMRVVEGGFAEYQVSKGASIKIQQDFTVYPIINYEIYYWYLLWSYYPETVKAIIAGDLFKAVYKGRTYDVQAVTLNGFFVREGEQILVKNNSYPAEPENFWLTPKNTLRDVDKSADRNFQEISSRARD